MYTQRLTKLGLLLSLACSLHAQQGNGANFSAITVVVGNQIQASNDTGVNGNILTTPITTGPQKASSWGVFHNIEHAADAAGTNHHGIALYNASGTLLCSTYPARTVVVGQNDYNLTGCGMPQPSTNYTLAILTDFGGDEPGDNNAAAFLFDHHCTGTSSFSSFVGGSSFPGTLSGLSAQSFCYSTWVDEILPGNANGSYFGGNAGFDNQVGGIPNGPWGVNGAWFGSQNVGNTIVSFSDGLTNATLPTTTALGNSTHGATCTWALASAFTVITGTTAGHLDLSTPVNISGTNYSGAGTLSFSYNTTSSTNRNRVTCTLGSSFTSFAIGHHLKTDIPITDPETNQYDVGGIYSADGLDILSPSIYSGGASLTLFLQCELNGTGTLLGNEVVIKPGVNYWVYYLKATAGATQSMYVFNQDKQGTYVGSTTCASFTGSHPSNNFTSTINGAEVNTSGLHVWEDQFVTNTTGAKIAP